MYPEATPFLEAWRGEMVVTNMVIPLEQADTPFTQAHCIMQEEYLAEIAGRFQVPLAQILLLSQEIQGIEMLAHLGEQISG